MSITMFTTIMLFVIGVVIAVIGHLSREEGVTGVGVFWCFIVAFFGFFVVCSADVWKRDVTKLTDCSLARTDHVLLVTTKDEQYTITDVYSYNKANSNNLWVVRSFNHYGLETKPRVIEVR